MGVVVRLTLTGFIIFGFGYMIVFNSKVLNWLETSKQVSNGAFYSILGRRLRKLNQKMQRVASVNKKSIFYKVNVYLQTIIENLDLTKDDVTPIGLLVFIGTISSCVSLFISTQLGSVFLVLPSFGAVFYLILVLFRLASLTRSEKREGEIMDAMDLIVSDIKGGTYNAIVRYKDSFHPNIRPYFVSFLDDINNKGYSFKNAMLNLNAKLGVGFSDFAQKAILYEEKADSDMEDIFSSIIETNRHRRTLRYINNQEFSKLRTELIMSLLLITGYCLFAMATDPFLASFFKNQFLGKILIIVDIVSVAWVLGYNASLKAKSL